MRNRFSVLFSVLGISLMMLLTAASTGTLHAQCNTAPAVGPVNYTINMGGTQAIITQASLAGVVNPVNGGIAPCDVGCELAYATTGPAGAYTLFSGTPLVVVCNGTSFPFSIWVRAQNGSGCTSAPVEVIIDVNDTKAPTILCPANQVVNTDPMVCTADIPGLVFTDVTSLDAANPLEYGDNCNTPSISYSLNGGAAVFSNDLSSIQFSLGVTNVLMTVDDGNQTATCNFTVTVNDNQDPTWVAESTTISDWYTIIGVSPASNAIVSLNYGGPGTNRFTVTLNCDSPDFATVNNYFATIYVPTAADNCTANPTEIFNDEFDVLPWVCPTTSHIRRRWTAADGNGNAITPVPPGPTGPLAKLDLIVQNTVDPVFVIAPMDTTILAIDPMTCGAELSGTTVLQVVAANDCQGAPTYSWVITSFPALFAGATSSIGNDNNADQFYVPGTYNITYTAIDACGNNETHSFMFEIVDDVDPMISCPPNQILDNVLDNCFQNTIWDEATVSDNCPGSLSLNVAGVTLPNNDPLNIITFSGGGGCMDVSGFQGPIYDAGLWTQSVAGDGAISIAGAPASISMQASTGPTTDNVDFTVTTVDDGIIYFAWSYTPTPPVSTADFGYLVNGAFSPIILGAANFEAGFASFPVNAGDVIGFRLRGENGPDRPTVVVSGFQFLCGSSSNIGFASFPVGQSIVTYTVTDAAMNTATCSFSVTVNDIQVPEITCGGDLFLPTICSNAGIPDYTGNIAVINENCPDYTISQLPAAGTTLGTIFAPMMPVDGGTFDVTLEITDKGGNTDQCVFTVTLQDNNAPVPDVMPLPAINPGTTLFTDCSSFMLCAPTATDCNGNVIYGTASIAGATLVPNGCGPGMPGYLINAAGNYAVNWIYDDGNGNFAQQSQQVDLFDDTTDPTLNCPPDITVDTDPGLCTTTGLANLDMTETFPTVAPYLDASDQPQDGEMIDNCGITMIGWASNTGSSANTNNAGTGTYVKGANIVTYTASDDAGNTGTCSFTITVIDQEDPSFTCVGDQNLSTGSAGDDVSGDCAYTLGGADTSLDPTMVTDNCPGPYTVSYSMSILTMGAGFGPGADLSSLKGSTFSLPGTGLSANYIVTWTVTDASNNTTTCTYQISVVDGENPTITCAASPIVKTTSQDGLGNYDCAYTVSGAEFDPVATGDNCIVTLVQNDFNFSSSLNAEDFPKGTTNVIWTVSDAEGNTATCSISVTVNDDESPLQVVNCPMNVTLPNIAGDCNNDVAWLRPYQDYWVDNCDASSDLTVVETINDPGVQAAINNNYPYDQTNPLSIPQTSFPVGTTTILYTVTDQSNNTSTCSFTVTIEDIEAPQVICPADQVLGITCGQGSVQNYIPSITLVSDNCSDYTITQNPAAGTNLALVPGLTPADGEVFDVTITVTDNNPQGLSTSCTFTVTLDEVSVPVPTINGPSLPPAFSECNDITIAAPTALECGNTIYGIPSQGTLVNVSPPVYQYGIGNYFVIWTYVGTNGSVQQSQQITVLEDLTPPNAQCKPVNVNLSSSNPGSVSVNATAFNNNSTDNCSIVGYSFSVNGGAYSSSKMFGCSEVGVHNISLEVLDFNGNKGYCATTLTINDVTPPTIIGGCPSNLSVNTSNDGGYNCSGLATIPVPNVSDNCAIGSYTLTLNGPDGISNLNAQISNPLFATLSKGLTNATYTVIDEHGLSANCSFSITVIDNELPGITCAASGSRNTSADGQGDCEYTINGNEFDPISFIDNCPGATITNSLNNSSSLAGVVLTTGTYPVTWTVTDAVGLTATCTLEITVVDDEAPIINFCQSNKTQNVTAGTCNALVTWSPTFEGTGDVDDNCGISTITESISDPDVVPVYPYFQNGPYPPFLLNQALFPIGITTISYTVNDINGNSSVCSFTIEVIDNIAPTVTCPPNQTMNTICADGTVQDYLGLIQNVSDNCAGNLIYDQSPAEGTLLANVPGLTPADGESFTVTITVTDPNPLGLSGNCSFTVTLDDVNLPVPDQASLPKDSTDCNSLILSPPTANDCGDIINGIPDKGNQISFNPPLYEFTTGLYTVIWTYVGTNGSVQQTQQIIVEDDLVPPVMDCDDITINLDAAGNASITPAQIDGGTKDNCGIANLSLSQSIFTCAHVGNNTVTLTAVDVHGNSNTCTANVLVRDVTAPTFNTGNSTITANCQTIPPVPNVLPSDACGILSNIFNETTTKGLNPNNCNFYTYTIVRTWTATDVNNNVSTLQQVINVQDVEDPVWTSAMPDTIYGVTNPFNCQGQILLVVDNIKLTDNCAAFANLAVTFQGTNGSSGTLNASGQYPIGETTLFFTATDPCGNHSFKEVVIIIEDKTPPTAVCVNSITLPLNPQGDLVIPAFIVDNGSYDNCLTPFSTNEVTLDVFPDTFDCDDAGKSFTITLTVTDLAGNTASCPATLTVIDNTIPTLISCAPDVTIDCQNTIDPLVLGFPTVSDACGTSFNFTDATVTVGGTICYNIIRTWSIIDGSGNNLNCTQTISVTDNQAPVFTSSLPADITIACGVNPPTPPTLVATDNCGTPVTVGITETSTQTSNNTCTDYAYVVTRTWTATDACGNATFHTQTITVVDIQAPVIFGLPVDTVFLYTNDFNADSCTVDVNLVAQIIDCQDASDIVVTNNSPVGSGGISASGKYSADQLYTITFTATDLCGNQSQRTVHIRVIDNSIPNAFCIAQVNVSLNSDGLAVITSAQIDDLSKDNCTAYPDLAFTLSQDSFDCKDLGVNIVQMTVTDQQGNSNTCSSSINVDADPALTINTTVNVTPETFMNANDGAIDVTVTGGSGQFTYLWTPGNAITPSIANLASGTYTLMITDVNTGCMKTIQVFVQIAGVPFDTISGKILTPWGKPVARTYVNMTGSQSGTYFTDIDGYYEFIVPSGSTVTVRPSKDTLPANGVTSLDFAIIQQHILAPPNLKPLQQTWQLIAADENGNNQINGIDIAQFQFTILNNKDTFPNVTSWVFVDASHVFPMPTEPWATGWPDQVTYPVISGNKPNTDFIAIKMGDVNGDVDTTKVTGGDIELTRSDDAMILSIQDQKLVQGQTLAVPVTVGNIEAIRAYQLAWAFDPSVLQFTGATGQVLSGMSIGNFGTDDQVNGLLTHLWASPNSTQLNTGDVMFTMYFNVLADQARLSDILDLTTSYVGEIAYVDPQTPVGIDLVFQPIQDQPETTVPFALLGNRPNPFSDQTLIEFTLPQAGPVKLMVMDLTGKPVLVRRTEGVAGYNAIPVHQSEMSVPGLYHYILESNGSRALGKLIYQD